MSKSGGTARAASGADKVQYNRNWVKLAFSASSATGADEVQYNAYSGDMVYTFNERKNGSISNSDQYRIAVERNADGYRRVTLPSSGKYLDSLNKELGRLNDNFAIEMIAPTQGEMLRAEKLGFKRSSIEGIGGGDYKITYTREKKISN